MQLPDSKLGTVCVVVSNLKEENRKELNFLTIFLFVSLSIFCVLSISVKLFNHIFMLLYVRIIVYLFLRINPQHHFIQDFHNFNHFTLQKN